MTGQWQKINTLDAEALAVFKAAYPQNLAVSYQAIAPYYKQTVAGCHYIFTVEAIVCSPTTKPCIKYLQTFQALPHEGSKVTTAKVLDQLALQVDPALDFFLDQRFPIGGWHRHEELDVDVIKIFNAAKPQRLGFEYTAIAPYYSQVVNGINYVFAALAKPVVPHTAAQSVVFLKTYCATNGDIQPAIIIGAPHIENVA